MTDTTDTKETFFKPTKMSAQAKAQQTDTTAREIMAAEVNAREKKTEKLRAMRMAQPEPVEEAPKPKAKAKVKKTAPKRASAKAPDSTS
ncbi:hypothetical protein ACQQ2Q_09625 [Agrobacterium sp. ES01]|uniref:hypothetical protein n=1 Tax=Agrobacterium sp. ES01 TaxID=3420714 RepID=UPI003D0D91A9